MAYVKRNLLANAIESATRDAANEDLPTVPYSGSAWMPAQGMSLRRLLERNLRELRKDADMKRKACGLPVIDKSQMLYTSQWQDRSSVSSGSSDSGSSSPGPSSPGYSSPGSSIERKLKFSFSSSDSDEFEESGTAPDIEFDDVSEDNDDWRSTSGDSDDLPFRNKMRAYSK
ncbi:uncharacterized protein LY89DRAFT_666919 [Mollisia scopiformis]|uniref:Uncharacterized protein n=1 Tax=Mollisia scopiformis TaxID=149040 RepID=A0A194XIZ6_MOLSC|nr:uncharacterized protein LY89DRAFT_666919 [Mollisia scopiformis]KUJ20096.1 hypothetical protein LY89DRAFT_666919 [Mollisia scopiformis]